MQLRSNVIYGLAGALLVAACDGLGSGNGAAGIASFGSSFVEMFEADSNDEPVDAQSIDIAVNLTSDPFNP